ncbi:MAG: TRAP transporter substrate-binding protein DctP [Phycisphaerae bacterium]|nr:TRAP transporter substrate-binding protein DctP [Phycisphaerae bacterium]
MGGKASSFIAGLLVGVALTAGVAAAVARLAASNSPAPIRQQSSYEGEEIRSRSLRLGHGLTTDHPVHLGLVRFAELVGERSDGRITIRIFPNGELGAETTMIEQLQSGTLDIAKASAAPIGSFAPDFAVFSVPYAFRSSEHCWAVLDGPIGREILDSLSSRGLHGLTYFDAGARSFYTVGEPILTPGDVEGLKVRVMESRTAMDMVEAFGGSPTPMSYAELYSALQSRLVDAAENNPPSFLNSRHYEVAKHFTLNEHSRVPDVLMVSRRTWDDLSGVERAIFEEAAAEASVYERRLWAERTAAALEEVRALGVTVHDVQRAPFAAAVAELRASYDGRIGELLERIDGVSVDADG